MTLKDKEQKIKQEFDQLHDWQDKYEYILYLGNSLPKQDNTFRTEDKLIYGCQSKVWLDAKLIGMKIIFDADSDALIPKGLIAIMINVYSGRYPFEIISSKANFISDIGFNNFLTPIRSNGLLLFLKKIKFYAQYFSTNS
ncbi:SufE family protein [Blattabacterium cuenoti]